MYSLGFVLFYFLFIYDCYKILEIFPLLLDSVDLCTVFFIIINRFTWNLVSLCISIRRIFFRVIIHYQVSLVLYTFVVLLLFFEYWARNTLYYLQLGWTSLWLIKIRPVKFRCNYDPLYSEITKINGLVFSILS